MLYIIPLVVYGAKWMLYIYHVDVDFYPETHRPVLGEVIMTLILVRKKVTCIDVR